MMDTQTAKVLAEAEKLGQAGGRQLRDGRAAADGAGGREVGRGARR